MTRFLSDDEVAAIMGIKRSTLQKNRSIGENHPPYIKLGGRVRYPEIEVIKWLEKKPLCRELADAGPETKNQVTQIRAGKGQ